MSAKWTESHYCDHFTKTYELEAHSVRLSKHQAIKIYISRTFSTFRKLKFYTRTQITKQKETQNDYLLNTNIFFSSYTHLLLCGRISSILELLFTIGRCKNWTWWSVSPMDVSETKNHLPNRYLLRLFYVYFTWKPLSSPKFASLDPVKACWLLVKKNHEYGKCNNVIR